MVSAWSWVTFVLLPVFFFISAVAGGLAMTIFESFLSRRAFGKRLEGDLLRGLGRVIVVVLAVPRGAGGVGVGLLWFAALLTLLTGVDYFRKAMPHLREDG